MPTSRTAADQGVTAAAATGVLVVAVIAISSSAVLVRWADAPPVGIAFWRTAGGALVLIGPSLPAPVQPRRHHWRGFAVAGTALAVHFATWLASLEMTSVAASVTLVTSAPLLLAVAGVATGRRPTRRTWLAVVIAMVGATVITGGDATATPRALAGDGLALVGAAMMAIYLTAGDRLRSTLSTAVYASRTYGVAAAVLAVVAVIARIPLWGYSGSTWLAIGAMIAGPQLAGHTALNLVLRRLGPLTVALALLAEPVGATVLVWLLVGERPPLAAVVGAPLVMAGLAIQLTGSSRSATAVTAN